MRRTLRALDGFETSATLARLVGGYLKETEDAGRLAQSAREAAREQGRGFLVPILADAARSGDTEAANLFVGAAGWLAAQVRAALRRLSFPAESSLVVARAGGLWEVGPLLIDPFERVLRRWHPEATVIAPDGSPLVGSLRLAQSLLASR
ncbi:MAG: hypothetical protein H7Z41_00200 [Cytophagales bacterium]|nr:hypothetical protein [Armatimonadota bacterium]